MPQRRKIEMVGAERFTISDVNPNAAAGLPGCACGSWRCPAPFLVFPTRLMGGKRAGFVSVSLACAKKGVLDYERGGETASVGSARPGEDGPPAPIHPVEGSTNPYFKTGVGSGADARPMSRLLAEKEQETLAALYGEDPPEDDPEYSKDTPGYPGTTATDEH